MKLHSSFFSTLVPLALLVSASACSSDSADSSGSGATTGVGGSDGTGGTATGGMGGDVSECSDPTEGPWGDALEEGTLGAKYTSYFPLGAALATWHLDDATAAAVAEEHFNHFTAENSMKPEGMQPTEGNFNWTEADKLANFARARNQKITFHTLVWHRQTPDWFFAGLTPGNADDIETLTNRMRLHIEAMVDRYADVVSNWDVVNEAVSDGGGGYRTDSPWYEHFGGPEYIYWAFHYTREALEAQEPCSSVGKLYYNDFNVNQKVADILAIGDLVESMGGRIDGIGDQAHYRIDWPSTTEIGTVYQAIVDAGYKLKISELDVTVYNDYPEGMYTEAPEVLFTEALENEQAARYAALFQLFRDFAPHITSVTFWGINDDRSWLNNEPAAGRDNYPLLWDASFEPKAAFDAVLDF